MPVGARVQNSSGSTFVGLGWQPPPGVIAAAAALAGASPWLPFIFSERSGGRWIFSITSRFRLSLKACSHPNGAEFSTARRRVSRKRTNQHELLNIKHMMGHESDGVGSNERRVTEQTNVEVIVRGPASRA